MTELTREIVQDWVKADNHQVYVCEDCEGIHFQAWEDRDAVLEARCFVEADRVSLLVEIAIRGSAVLPLQGAIHFMNYDHGLLKVMLSMSDNDVPRLLLTHAMPKAFLTEEQFQDWLQQLLGEMDAVYKHLIEMEVLFVDDFDMLDLDDRLH